jgi:hypothetical protein
MKLSKSDFKIIYNKMSNSSASANKHLINNLVGGGNVLNNELSVIAKKYDNEYFSKVLSKINKHIIARDEQTSVDDSAELFHGGNPLISDNLSSDITVPTNIQIIDLNRALLGGGSSNNFNLFDFDTDTDMSDVSLIKNINIVSIANNDNNKKTQSGGNPFLKTKKKHSTVYPSVIAPSTESQTIDDYSTISEFNVSDDYDSATSSDMFVGNGGDYDSATSSDMFVGNGGDYDSATSSDMFVGNGGDYDSATSSDMPANVMFGGNNYNDELATTTDLPMNYTNSNNKYNNKNTIQLNLPINDADTESSVNSFFF